MARPSRTLALVPLLLAASLAGCLDAPALELAAAPEEPRLPPLDADGLVAERFDGWVHGFAEFASGDGTALQVDYYLPEGAGEDERFPVVLVMSPYWGGRKDVLDPERKVTYPLYRQFVEDYVPRGYAAAYVDTRGMAGSEGCWDFMGPGEQADALAAVAWAGTQPWSSGKVGMFGLSYDGMTQIMAMTQAPEHLVTVVPAAPLTSAYKGLYQNGVHYGGAWWLTTTQYARSDLTPPGAMVERYPGWARSLADQPDCVPETAVEGNPLDGARNEFYRARDFTERAKDVRASVFFLQGFRDANVKPDNLLPFWSELDVPKKAWLWHGYHQYPTKQATGGRDDLDLEVHRWFDRWLHDVPNGVDDDLTVQVQDGLGRWRREAEWPPADAQTVALHLADGAALARVAPAASKATFTAHPLTNLAAGGFEPGTFLAYAGAPLDSDLHVAGVPRLALQVAADGARGQVAAGLYDVAPDGATWTLVDRGVLDLRLREGLDEAKPVPPGTTLDVAFDLYPTDWVFRAGHRVALVVAGADWPWFTPDASRTTFTVTHGDGSALLLPVVAGRSEFFAETVSPAIEGAPRIPPPVADGARPGPLLVR